MIKHAHEKGRRAELYVAEMLRRYGFSARRTPLSGAIPYWREDITAPDFPFAIEVKNQESWKTLDWYKEAEVKSSKPTLLVVTKNGEPFYCFLLLTDIMDIITKKKSFVIKTPEKPKKFSMEETSKLRFSKSWQARRAKK